jgi:hypothetical protein
MDLRDQKVAKSSFLMLVMNIWPGEWVMTRSGLFFMRATWGVTPQAQ